MNIGIIGERGPFDRRVALTPPVVRRLAGAGHTVWVETGAGDGAMYPDAEYQRAGAQIAYSPEEIIGRAELLAKIGRPTAAELDCCAPGMALMAFYHMAVAGRGLVDTLAERSLTAIGCEVIQQEDGRLPVLAAISEIAGQMTVPIAAHLLRSSSRRARDSARRNARGTAGASGGAGRGRRRVCRRAHRGRSGARVMAFDRDPAQTAPHRRNTRRRWKPAWPTRTRLPKPWPAPTW